MKRKSGEKRLREKKSRTAYGIKPIGKVQWNFKAYYLYGAIAPQTGESFGLESSHLVCLCFQIFLDKLAAYPEHLNVIQLDNGRFHLSSQLIPEKVLLIFQPPYSPELNPFLTSMALYKTRTELGNL